MIRIDNAAVGVARGEAILFSAFEDDGEMWTGHGPRLVRHDVRFDTLFMTPPVVHVGIAMWDVDINSNQRVDIAPEDITTQGFSILFRTWADTRVARIRASWLAIGPVGFRDDFDVDML